MSNTPKPDQPISVRGLIRDMLDTTDMIEVEAIVAQVYGAIKRNEFGAALYGAIRELVPIEMSRQRSAANPHGAPAGTHSTERPGPHLLSGNSPRVQAIREGWQAHLRTRYPAAHGGYVMLADMTYEDLLANATSRREHAAATLANAERLEKLAAALQETSKERVGDLPQDRLRELLG